MTMRQLTPTLVTGLMTLMAAALTLLDPSDTEKPIQHLDLPDVVTMEEAKTVFSDTTEQLQSKTELDAQELNDIHIITYSLEKALAYFVENSENEMKALATRMAVVIEEVHLGSENNRVDETRRSLDEYFRLAEKFSNAL